MISSQSLGILNIIHLCCVAQSLSHWIIRCIYTRVLSASQRRYISQSCAFTFLDSLLLSPRRVYSAAWSSSAKIMPRRDYHFGKLYQNCILYILSFDTDLVEHAYTYILVAHLSIKFMVIFSHRQKCGVLCCELLYRKINACKTRSLCAPQSFTLRAWHTLRDMSLRFRTDYKFYMRLSCIRM